MSSISSLRFLFIALLAVAAPARPRGKRKGKRLKPGTLAHFEEFCRRFIVLDNGQPFELEPFQRLILKGFFAGVTEVLVLLPKKNGKTTLLAALALYHLIYTPDAACYIAASAKDQARVMYDQAVGFVERKDGVGRLTPQAEALQKRVLLRKGTREIRSRRDSGFVRVVSGDKDTVDGVIPTLALVDELHRHKDGGELFGVLADGLGPRNGQLVVISTPGETLKSALGRMWVRALELPGVKRRGKYTFVRSPNGKFELHSWGLDPEKDDVEDLEVVKLANPLSTNTLEKLEQRRSSPGMTPSRWKRFGCGIWTQGGEDAAVSQIDWAGAGRKGLKLEEGTEVYVGLDVGLRWDTTAIVPVEPHDAEDVLGPDEEEMPSDPDQRWWRFRKIRIGRPTILTPPRDGTSMRRQRVIDAVLRLRDKQGLVILGVVGDPNAGARDIGQDLEELHGIDFIEHSQDPAPMSEASMGFAEAVGNGEVEHPDDPELNAHILAAQAGTTRGEKWRFVAPKTGRGSRKKGRQEGDDIEVIDGAIAAAIAWRVATAPVAPETPAPSVEIWT